MYDPSIGRFITMDPIGEGDGPNEYEYVHDDPINHTDPTGLATQPGPTTKPTTAGGEEITGNVDLILFAGDPTDVDSGMKGVYDDLVKIGNAKKIPVKVVANKQDIINAVNAVNKDKGKPLNVVVFGHGGRVNGPLFGSGNNESAMLDGWKDANDACTTGFGTKEEKEQSALDDIKKGDQKFINALKGKINSITFGGCNLASTPAGIKLLQIYSDLLGAHITAFAQGVDENSNGTTFSFDPHEAPQPGFIHEFDPQ